MQTGASWCEIDRSIDALRGRPLPGNRARSARGGRARILLVGAGGTCRAGPPCRPEEARRTRAVGHRAAADGGPKVEGARLARDRSCFTGVQACATPTWISCPLMQSPCMSLQISFFVFDSPLPSAMNSTQDLCKHSPPPAAMRSAARRHGQVLCRASSYTSR